MPTSDLLAGAAAQLAQALPQEDAEAVVEAHLKMKQSYAHNIIGLFRSLDSD